MDVCTYFLISVNSEYHNFKRKRLLMANKRIEFKAVKAYWLLRHYQYQRESAQASGYIFH